MSAATYPAHVDATLEQGMSRWLWLVKWLLAIPHFVVLFFLWIAFVAVSLMAFVAILVTGRYPIALFEFNVGVLRWTWRVLYYTYGALGTDRYPPFTLADVPEYPAHFEVDHPAQLSRGLVLVKWWLLAIPHYLVLAVFAAGGWAVWWAAGAVGGPGLIGLLVLIAAIVLACTGRYPAGIFDFVLAMNRWALRVATYAALMTDRYPPFRLDLGGHETAGGAPIPAPATGTSGTPSPAPPARAPEARVPEKGWSAGRVVSVVAGSLIGLLALGTLGAGAVATWATTAQRDAAGYVTTPALTFDTTTYAIVSDAVDLGGPTGRITPRDALGTVRIRVTASDPGRAVFVGVGSAASVQQYLAGVDHLVMSSWPTALRREVDATGTAGPATPPADAPGWLAAAAGPGTQTLTWTPTGGRWVVVVMNADGRAGVAVTADVGATVPALGWIAAGLFALGIVLLGSAVVLIVAPVVRARR